MKFWLGSVLMASVALAATAGAAQEESAGIRADPVHVAVADLDCIDQVSLGNGRERAGMSAMGQDARLQEYLELHAQAADDGRVLLPWSVPIAPATH